RVAGNVQTQDEARAVAQQAIEKIVGSKANFYPTPTGAPATGYDVNGDGTADYTVTVTTPVCKRAAYQIPAVYLPDCGSGVKAGLYCWDTLWEVTATAQDPKSGTKQVITQGVSVPFDPTFLPSTV